MSGLEKTAALVEGAPSVKDLVAIGIISLALGVALSLPGYLLSGSEGDEAPADSPKVAQIDTADISAGVAATVNDTQIGEAAITAYIGNFRMANGLETEDAWGTWLANNGYNAESLRSETLEYFVNQELMRQVAAKNGIQVTDVEVDSRVDEARSAYPGEEEWQRALLASGTTEEGFRQSVEMTILQEKLADFASGGSAASDEEVLSAVQAYAPYYSGAKRSSHILFDAGDGDSAEDVYSRLRSGDLSFEEAVARFSTDESTRDAGGDRGFDKLSSVTDEYAAALSSLGAGDVSEPFADSEGIHIVMCTEVLDVPAEITSLDQITPGFVEVIRKQADSSSAQMSFAKFMSEFKSTSDVRTVPMGEGLPYDIDLTPYVEALYESDGSTDSIETAADSSKEAE